MATLGAEDVQGALERFRAALEERDLIHPGDSIGTDDATLLCAVSFLYISCRLDLLTAGFFGPGRRFLRARQYDVDKALTMWTKCQEWRKTVTGDGIDELYKRLDPLYVCALHGFMTRTGDTDCT